MFNIFLELNIKNSNTIIWAMNYFEFYSVSNIYL